MSAPSFLFSSYPFQVPERLEKSCDSVTMVPFLILEFINFANWKQNSYYFVNSLKLSLVLSPGGPRSTWVNSGDNLKDKEG